MPVSFAQRRPRATPRGASKCRFSPGSFHQLLARPSQSPPWLVTLTSHASVNPQRAKWAVRTMGTGPAPPYRGGMENALCRPGPSKPRTALELCALGATALAARIARGEVTAVEAVEAYVARLQGVNPGLNALGVERFS